jgi:hypothetical protein
MHEPLARGAPKPTPTSPTDPGLVFSIRLPNPNLICLLPLRPATATKWLRRRLAWGRHDEELNDRGAEGIRKLLEQRDGWVFQPTFETANVGSIDTGVGGESFLRQIALDPESPEIPRHKCLRPHAERRALRNALNHGL